MDMRFANAQGGKIYSGKKDDGTVIGVSDAKKLMEDIPNKIQNKLGIVADMYQDEVYGSLLLMADRVIDLIYLKYLKAAVSYHKETRVETYPFARDAVREAVYNALLHCNWADNNPIQIRIEDDAMYISNSSLLPFGWTAETLLETHSSKPFNPDIARVFYRAGYIESWGRGIQKICDACKNLGTDGPVYIVHGEDIMVKFHALQSAKVAEPKVL